MLIVSNKTEEDRAADRAALLLPGGIITFFLGFFMLKDMGMKGLSIFFSVCYLVFFCGIIMIMAYYRKTRMVPVLCISAAVFLVVLYRDSVLTVNIVVPLTAVFLFYLLNRLFKKKGFAVFMLANIIFWVIEETDDKLLIGLLVIGSIYALAQFLGRNAEAHVFSIVILIFVVLIPIGDGPFKWTFLTRFLDTIAGVDSIDEEEYERRTKKGPVYMGYSENGMLQGPLNTNARVEITFQGDHVRGSIYLEGSRFATVEPTGLTGKEDLDKTRYDWFFYFVNCLMNAGISPEEASQFTYIDNAEIEYKYISISDLITPPNPLKVTVEENLINEENGKKAIGYKYKVSYLTIKQTDPLYEKMMSISADGHENKVYTYAEAADYVSQAYGGVIELSDILDASKYNEIAKRTTDWDAYIDKIRNEGIQAVDNGSGSEQGQAVDNGGGSEQGQAVDNGGSEQEQEAGNEWIDDGNDQAADRERYETVSEHDIEDYLDTGMATERMRALVKYIVKDCSSDYERAAAIEKYLNEHISYNKKVDLRGYDNYVDEFLFEMKKGYCVHFASTMTVMLRIAGVPSRYVNGYYFKNKVISVMSTEAHAWAEAYIRGVGWVPFEPTSTGNFEGQQTYEPEEIIEDEGVEDTEQTEITEKTEKKTEAAMVIKQLLMYLGIILGAAALFILIMIVIRKLIFMHLPPERKLQEIVRRELKDIEKSIKDDEEKQALRANSSSLYDYIKYAYGDDSKKNLKKLLDTYYRVRFRGDDITEDEVRCFLQKNN